MRVKLSGIQIIHTLKLYMIIIDNSIRIIHINVLFIVLTDVSINNDTRNNKQIISGLKYY